MRETIWTKIRRQGGSRLLRCISALLLTLVAVLGTAGCTIAAAGERIPAVSAAEYRSSASFTHTHGYQGHHGSDYSGWLSGDGYDDYDDYGYSDDYEHHDEYGYSDDYEHHDEYGYSDDYEHYDEYSYSDDYEHHGEYGYSDDDDRYDDDDDYEDSDYGWSYDGRAEDTDAGEVEVEESGEYTSMEEVAAYLNEFGHLPDNFITKKEAKKLGWVSREGNLGEVAPGKSIGGDYFGNYEGLLPEKKGREYHECDIDSTGGYRGAKRIIYSNDGLIYYTEDHYESFELLYGDEES